MQTLKLATIHFGNHMRAKEWFAENIDFEYQDHHELGEHIWAVPEIEDLEQVPDYIKDFIELLTQKEYTFIRWEKF